MLSRRTRLCRRVWATAAFAFSRYHDMAFKDTTGRGAASPNKTRGDEAEIHSIQGTMVLRRMCIEILGTEGSPLSDEDGVSLRRTPIINSIMGACTYKSRVKGAGRVKV